jgi:hypothetical protein
MDFRHPPFYFGFKITHNGLRVGDVALCCPACAGARQYCLHAVSC